MLYGNQSISYYSPSNIVIWMAMALQAGLLNVGGYLACHQFVSHVTGYATLFGLELSRLSFAHALGLLLVPLFFLGGAALSGLLVDLPLMMKKRPRYYLIFGLIFGLSLLVAGGGSVGWFGPFGEPLSKGRDYLLLAILCLLCGAQNGMVTTVSRSIIRTTHLTGITTDLGIGLVRSWNRAYLGERGTEENKANLMRLGIILFFGLGSVLGAVVFPRLGYMGFLLPAFSSGGLFLAMIYFQLVKPGAR